MTAQPAAATLRDALPGDGQAVARIYAHHVLTGFGSFEETPPDAAEMEHRRAAVQEQGLPYLVAEADGNVVAFAYAGPYRPRAAYRFTVEDSVYVAAAAGGRGIGRLLLAELVRRAEGLGMRQMIAVIGDSANAGSIGVHARCGFRMIGTHPNVGFKFGRWLDTVMMQRALGEGGSTVPKD